MYVELINWSCWVYNLANRIRLVHCNFINISGSNHLIMVKSYQNGFVYPLISIKSNFYNISHATILSSETENNSKTKPKVIIYVHGQCKKIMELNK